MHIRLTRPAHPATRALWRAAQGDPAWPLEDASWTAWRRFVSEGQAMELLGEGRLWLIRARGSVRWETAGFTLAHRIPDDLRPGEPEAWEMGTYLLPAWRGTFVNPAVKWLAARWVFRHTGAAALLFTVAADHAQARRALDKLGWPLDTPPPHGGPYARYHRWRSWSERREVVLYVLRRERAHALPKPGIGAGPGLPGDTQTAWPKPFAGEIGRSKPGEAGQALDPQGEDRQLAGEQEHAHDRQQDTAHAGGRVGVTQQGPDGGQRDGEHQEGQ